MDIEEAANIACTSLLPGKSKKRYEGHIFLRVCMKCLVSMTIDFFYLKFLLI